MVIVVVDPGHGGADTGAVREGLVEKELTLDIARRIRFHVDPHIELRLTRQDDIEVLPPARAAIVSNTNASILVSLHTSTRQRHTGNPGIQVHYAVGSEPGRRLALILHEHLTHTAGVPGRGVQPRYHWLLRSCNVPAAWIEIGSLNHPDDAARLGRVEHRKHLAGAIAKGVEAFLGEWVRRPIAARLPETDADAWAEKAISRITSLRYSVKPNVAGLVLPGPQQESLLEPNPTDDHSALAMPTTAGQDDMGSGATFPLSQVLTVPGLAARAERFAGRRHRGIAKSTVALTKNSHRGR